MTNEEIIKVLDCCAKAIHKGCRNCPLFAVNGCVRTMSENALDLIKRQQEEINNLQKRIVFWREDMDYHPERERAKAIKELMMNLDGELLDYSNAGHSLDIYEWLQNYIKEMLGEE